MEFITVWCAGDMIHVVQVGVATSGNAIVMSYCCDSDLPKVGRLVEALVVCSIGCLQINVDIFFQKFQFTLCSSLSFSLCSN